MHYAIIFVILLTFVFGLGLLARRISVPYPILFVVGGLITSFIPQLPRLQLDPDFIFFIFLPPLLYIQAFNTSWRDFRRDLRAISLLAIGLVLATTVTVAYVAHWLIPDFPLAAGFVLGAIISPPDAVAASAIANRLGLPRRVVTILEGESLVNDATSLVIFKVALASAAMVVVENHGVPHNGNAWLPGMFLYAAIGGIAVGLAVGWVVGHIRKRITEDGPQIALTMSLLTPYASYLAGEQIHVSSVLAVVSTGLYLGWEAPEIMTSGIRLQWQAVWQIILYLLNGFIFILIGLQLPGILAGIATESRWNLLLYALVVNFVCIAVRLGWVFPGAFLPRLLSRRIREQEPCPEWRQVFIIGWSGMRGVVSLAAALALDGYADFPRAHLIQFLAFTVILTTLVFQGLTLPPLIRYLNVGDDGIAAREEKEARHRISDAAMDKIAEIKSEDKYPSSAIEMIEQFYRERALALKDELAEQLGWSQKRNHVLSTRRLRRIMISTQRRTLLQMRRTGVIGDDVMHKIEHELDLEEARFKV